MSIITLSLISSSLYFFNLSNSSLVSCGPVSFWIIWLSASYLLTKFSQSRISAILIPFLEALNDYAGPMPFAVVPIELDPKDCSFHLS